MRRFAVVIVACGAVWSAAPAAQSPGFSAAPAFDVASVKVNDSGATNTSSRSGKGCGDDLVDRTLEAEHLPIGAQRA